MYYRAIRNDMLRSKAITLTTMLFVAAAAMLVALPAAIGFGVTVFSAIGPGFAVLGALAGIVGTIVIGIVASGLGGTARLVSAPCAPAAAVLSAFALDMAGRGDEPAVIVLLLVIIGVVAALGALTDWVLA